MARFRTRFIRRDGRRRAATLEAHDLASLGSQVESQFQGYVVEARRLEATAASRGRRRLSSSLLLAALDSLELMLVSGVRINSALRTLSLCAPRGTARLVWTEVVRQLEETGSFSDALRPFPRIFDDSMIGLVAAHEAAGRLPEGIRHVRTYVAQMRSIRRESLRAVAYPALVLVVGLAASGVLCVFTLPRFAKMLHDIGVKRTNRVTAFFFALSDFVVRHPLAAAAVVALPFAAAWVARRRPFRPACDRLLLRLPVVRGAIEALAMARICVTYRALSEAGIRVVEALEACAAVAGNAVYARGLASVVATVRDNAGVGAGFERARVFAPEVVLAVKSGEGSLPEVFGRLAEYYATEAKHRVALALGLLEPVMLIGVLIWVFGVALAVVLPVVEVVNEIH